MQFKRVPHLSSWKKFSVALWPAEATRFCKVELDLTTLQKQKSEQQVSWTSALIHALTRTLGQNPAFHQFIRHYQHYTRSDIDFFLRITLDDQKSSAESDSLWGMYLRACQNQSMQEIQKRILASKEKFSAKENRFPAIQKLFSYTPTLLTVAGVKILSWWIRMGLPAPGVSKLCFPSISMSNTGSIRSPLTQPLTNPLTNAPITVNFGPIQEMNGKYVMEAYFGFDHRVFDGQDISLFFDCLNQNLHSDKQ
jgi:chloramphenicol O-acetyltransferase